MAEIPTELEVERIMNLVRGFGWTKSEQKIVDDRVFLTIYKSVKVPETAGPE